MANYPKIKTASTVIAFDNPVSVLPDLTVTGPVTFTKSTTSQQPTWSTKITIIADGVNTPDFSAFDSIGTGVYDNTNGVKNICIFTYWGSSLYTVCITPVTVGSGSGDTTPPTVNGMVASAATSIFVTFNETVNTPSLSGWSFKKNGSTLAASAVSAVTGTVWEFTVATMASGDTITASYNSGTGSVQDLAGNPLASFTDASVSNTIGSTTLNAPTGVTLGTATSTTQPLTWTDTNSSPNESGYKVYYNTVNNLGTATLATTTAANATSYTVTGLTASTLYYYWVVAAGNGTTTSDSSPSTVASGSTGSAGYDTDATAYFTSESITDTTTKDAINALIVGLKADGVWTSNVKGIFLGHGSGLTNARTNTAATGTNLPTVSGGNYIFDGSNDVINTGITPSTDLSTTEAYFLKGTSFTGLMMIGSRESGAGTYVFYNSSGDVLFRLGASSDQTVTGQGGNGRYGIYRTSAGFVKMLKNGSMVYNTSASVTTASTKPLAFGASNENGAPFNPAAFAGGTVPYLIIATNLTDTQAANIDTRLATYLTALGL